MMYKLRYNEDGFENFVSQLINSSYLEQIESGIAKCMLDNGYNKLSPKQKNVFNRMINKYSTEYCKQCAAPIPWTEMYEAYENGGYCSVCEHTIQKIMNQ